MRLILKLFLLPIVLVSFPFLLAWNALNKRREDLDEEALMKLAALVNPYREHDDSIRRWPQDLSPQGRLDAVEAAMDKQSMSCIPSEPLQVWASRRGLTQLKKVG